MEAHLKLKISEGIVSDEWPVIRIVDLERRLNPVDDGIPKPWGQTFVRFVKTRIGLPLKR
ncbi:MAG: hypothetical protein BGO23_09660 [Solirubrobacterales bacterium 67-14]|nr:MAG: hypothetical protein BGO23_09660 [Solirubrobacterales bacterium 67-14]